MQIDGATVLITGASGGIGQALATAFADAGGRLVVTGRRSDALASLVAETGGQSVVADLSASGGIEAVVAGAGSVDILVANAGVPAGAQLTEIDAAGVDRVLDVNLAAPVRLAHALLPDMLERARGYLLFVSSLQGLSATPGAPLYVATKFGLRGFALALRQDLHGTGVSAGVLLPGFIREAGMFADSGAKLPPGVGTRSPAEVAAAAVRMVARDEPERTVAPAHLAAGAYLGGLAPGPAASIQRLLGGAELARRVGEGQRRSRGEENGGHARRLRDE